MDEMEAAEALLKFSSGAYYFAEKVLGHRIVFINGITRFEVLVKWQNSSRQTWEFLYGPGGIGDIDAVKEYVQRLKIRLTSRLA